MAPSAPEETTTNLLSAADAYFQAHETTDSTVAFPLAAGYPCYLAGRGVLPSDRLQLMVALGNAGYTMSARWLLFENAFADYVAERLPTLSELSLQIEEGDTPGFTLRVLQRSRPAAFLTVHLLPVLSSNTRIPTASLHRLDVQPAFRRKGIGRWLLLRCINELYRAGHPAPGHRRQPY